MAESPTAAPESAAGAAAPLANEVIAFLDDHDPQTTQDGTIDLGHDMSWHNGAVGDVMQTVVGLSKEEFCAAAGEIQAEAQALTTLIDQVQALGDRLGVNPRLTVRDNVKRWADAGDTEAAELLASGVLDTMRRA